MKIREECIIREASLVQAKISTAVKFSTLITRRNFPRSPTSCSA